MNKPIVVYLALLSVLPGSAVSQSQKNSESSFIQEKVRFFDATSGLGQVGFDAIHVHVGTVYARDKSLQWFHLKDDSRWEAQPGEPGAWDKTLLPAFLKESLSAVVHQAIRRKEDGCWIAATSHGLYAQPFPESLSMERMLVQDALGRQWATHDVLGITQDSLGQLWFATRAGVGCQTSTGWQFYTGEDGLPYNEFTQISAGPRGEVWFGTTKGLVRFRDGQWGYRQGKRWVPNDIIHSVKVDHHGHLWVATQTGVGVIQQQTMTLSEKAAHYEHEIETYIKRTPFGYISEVTLPEAGVKERIQYHDSDNDGLWTSMYGAGECFAFAATGNQDAARRAHQAFRALAFLQEVTQGGAHPAPKGYVARTIRSTTLPDPNDGRLERDKRFAMERDSLWKVYEPRWPVSADGKWYWKSDTSSDELDGHFFFYPLYYDLVAQTDDEKMAVRKVVAALMDHLILHDFQLVDHTGTVTRWGTYRPEDLNHHPDWWVERGLKSLSMLAYLAVASHITGDARYLEIQQRLIQDHAYDTNAMIYKIHRGLGSGNQSDDEMAFMCYYSLLKYTPAGSFRDRMLTSFYAAWRNEAPEGNPFFHFAYASQVHGTEVTDPWGRYSLTPSGDWLEDAMNTLKGFPLDRLNWASQNSHRLDIVALPPNNSIDLLQEDTRLRGHLRSGKVLPVENTHFNHWNTDPWSLDYGGSGNTLASGTVFLLPYYMGLYHGYIHGASGR